VCFLLFEYSLYISSISGSAHDPEMTRPLLDREDLKYGYQGEVPCLYNTDEPQNHVGICVDYGSCGSDHRREFERVAQKACYLFQTYVLPENPALPEYAFCVRGQAEKALDQVDHLFSNSYLIQEYVPNGKTHPLYMAMTQEHLSDFKAGVDAYSTAKFGERMLAVLMGLHKCIGKDSPVAHADSEAIRLVADVLHDEEERYIDQY